MLFITHILITNYLYQIVAYHGYTDMEMGISAAIAAVMEIPILFGFTRINKKISSGTLLKISGLFFTLRTALILIATDIGMIYFAQTMQLFGFGLYTGACVYYVDHTIEEEHRVQGQTCIALTNTIGSLVGSFFGGMILDSFSVPGMLIIGVIAGAFGTVLLFLFAEKGKKADDCSEVGKTV